MAAPAEEFASILLSFLEGLDALYDEDPGVTDTDVREILASVVIERLVKANPGHAIPSNFEMLDEAGELSTTMNRRVGSVVRRFVSEAEASSAWQACTSNAERQALIARDEVTTQAGNAYWLYLGPWDQVWQ